MDLRVTLVAADPDDRHDLSAHLERLGFAVVAARTLPRTGTHPLVVVCLSEAPTADSWRPVQAFIDRVIDRLVVITTRPVELRQRGLTPHERLTVLVPPVFPWQLRDALLDRCESLR